MKNVRPPADLNEAMGEAYEALLEKALANAHRTGAVFHRAIDEISGEFLALGRLGEDEIVTLADYVKRDLSDAARYMDKTGKALKDWLGFDWGLVKRDFWERFSAAADKTTTELMQIKLRAEYAEYHTGEFIGLGTLTCDQCGEKLHFHKPGRIPPCPKCTHTHFHRHPVE